MQRDGLSRDAAAAMIGAQTDRPSRLAAADDVIDNSGDLAATRKQVDRLHQRYLELGSFRRERSKFAQAAPRRAE